MPLPQQLLLDLIARPILASVWWLLSRGWAGAVQSGEITGKTKSRQRIGFAVLVAVLYALMFGTTTYLHPSK